MNGKEDWYGENNYHGNSHPARTDVHGLRAQRVSTFYTHAADAAIDADVARSARSGPHMARLLVAKRDPAALNGTAGPPDSFGVFGPIFVIPMQPPLGYNPAAVPSFPAIPQEFAN